jgi:hypothetical protein
MRFVLVALLLIHAAIHMMWVGRPGAGWLWAVPAAALVAAAVMVLLRRPSWWMLAAPAVVASQILIVGAWSQAKAGTIVNVLLVIPVVVAVAQARFRQGTDAAALRMMSAAPTAAGSVVTEEDLAPLPAPVRRWLQGAGVVGKPRPHTVRLRQRGWMRTAPDKPWMAARAEQYYTLDEPQFLWGARITMKGGIPLEGRDSYLGGHGRMQVRVAGLVSVADARGPKVDQGTLLRYLAEIIWFPAAALAPYIRWEPIDASSARAIMTYGGVSAPATFFFDEAGRNARMIADRYQGNGPSASLQRWEGVSRTWARRGGLLVPVTGSVTWKLPDGDFEWYRWEIADLELDRPQLYPAAEREAPPLEPAPSPLAIAGAR